MDAIIATFLNLTGIELALTFLAGSILLLLVVMVAYFRRMTASLAGGRAKHPKTEQLEDWVRESEIICDRLSKALEERKEIAHRLIAQLDARIETLRSMTVGMDRDEGAIVSESAGEDQELQILKMLDGGKDLQEVARQTGLSIGEVQFILNLKRYQESSSATI